MTTSPHTPHTPTTGSAAQEHLLAKPRLISLLVLGALLILCLVFAWTTRDAMRNLPSVTNRLKRGGAAQPLVDQTPWQTASALAPLAVSAEEIQYAREAERLADHSVDQAFASALLEAALKAQHRTLTGQALALSRKVTQLQQAVAQDQEQVKELTATQSAAANATKSPAQPGGGSNLDVAKAQLQLDSDELADTMRDLDRASGDVQPQIQAELAAHEAAMKKYESQAQSDGQIAVLSTAKYGTLAGRIGAWFGQHSRLALIQQASAEAQALVKSLTTQHDALDAQANAGAQAGASAAQDNATRLASIRNSSARRQILSIYDDRIQTEQQLASVYDKWAAQVQLQHTILLHLMLQSLAWIVLILICMVVGDGLVRKLMAQPVLDFRRRQTLRAILEVAIQVTGIGCILLVIFGAPQQTTTILGLATAAIAIVLQDFVLAFLGWFVLMGKRGMHVGDTVEINSVGGEVIEIGLMATTLLETGALAGEGHPTGRRITFMNGFAIRGQYFNFSTAGQWLWDQLVVSVPANIDTRALVEKIQEAVREETADNARHADHEWKRGLRGDKLSRLGTEATIELKPSSGSFDAEVRYVTRASERVETRNRIYRRVIEIMQQAPANA